MSLFAAGALATPAMADVKAGVDAWAHGDFATAIHEWEGPAAHGDADAQFDLGQAYKLGRGVPQDLAHAEMLFGQAAAQGHLQAADNYGLLLFQRGEHARAMPYVRAAAERGDPRAEYLLGIALFNGDTVDKDWTRAYALESLAQAAGLKQAAPALAQMDKFIPLEQRRQAVALEAELSQQIEANRNRQAASVDLGTNLPHGTAGPGMPASEMAASGMAGPPPFPPAPSASMVAAPAHLPLVGQTPPSSYAEASSAPMPAPAHAYAAPDAASGSPYMPPNGGNYSGFSGNAPAPMPTPVATGLPPAPRPLHTPRPMQVKPASTTMAHAHPTTSPTTDEAATTDTPPANKPAASGGSWKVQLGAFGVAANADAMWARAKSRPEIAGHQRQLIPSGKVNRLLATGYSEEAAHAACRKLTAQGITCLVTKD